MRSPSVVSALIILCAGSALAQVTGPAVGASTAGAGTAAAGGGSGAIGGGTMGPSSGASAPGGGPAAFAGGTMGPSTGAAVPGGGSSAVAGGTMGPSNGSAAPLANTGTSSSVTTSGGTGVSTLATPNPGYALPAGTVAATNGATSTTAIAAQQQRQLEAQGFLVVPTTPASAMVAGVYGANAATPGATINPNSQAGGTSAATGGGPTSSATSTAGIPAGTIDSFQLGAGARPVGSSGFQLPVAGSTNPPSMTTSTAR